MSALTKARFLLITDALAAAFVRLKGDATHGAGDAVAFPVPSNDGGARGRVGDLLVSIDAFNEADDYSDFQSALIKCAAQSSAQNLAPTAFKSAILGLDALCAAAMLPGASDINSFASYFNVGAGAADGAPWSALLAPEFAELYALVKGQRPGAKNVYAPTTQNLATRTVGSAFVAGVELETRSFAGAGVLQGVASGITGSGQITVVANGYNATGLFSQGRAYAATVTGNGTFPLLPVVAGDLPTRITDIQFPSGITAGTVRVDIAPPENRVPLN